MTRSETQGAARAAASVDEDFIAPACSAQQRLWLVDRRSPGTSAYTLSAAWRIVGELDVPALTCAVDSLVERHEVLRTKLAMLEGKLWQKVAKRRTSTLVIAEAGPGSDLEREIERLAGQEAVRHFDPMQGPLFAAHLFRFSADVHLLTLAMHHVVADEESLSILASELWQIYDACHDGREAALARSGVQYADFSAWQQERLSHGSCEISLRYWEEQLAGSSGLLELPLSRPTRATGQSAGDWVGFDFDPDTYRRLTSLAERTGASMFMAGATLLQLLLYRSTGLGDFLIGYPSTWRDRRELERVVGMFVNMMVLRSRIEGSISFAGLLACVREDVLQGHEHKHVPFEMLVERLAPDRRHGRNPLFQVAYAFGTANIEEVRTDRLRAELIPILKDAPKFDLTLYLKQSNGGFGGGFEFDARRFDRQAIELLAERLLALAGSAMQLPDCAIDRLPAISAKEREILSDLAETGTGPARFQPIADLVADHTRLHPRNIAVRWGDGCLTYRQLAGTVGAVQAALGATQVAPGEAIGIVLDPSPEFVAAILGTMRAGAAYVPLDPSLPTARLQLMAERLGIKCFLSLRRLGDQCPEGGKIVFLDGYVDGCDSSPEMPSMPIVPSQIAHFVYTSGSSGAPKAVAVSHAGLSALVAWHGAYHGLSPGTVATQIASPIFDACGWEILSCLGSGATLAIVPAEARRDPVALCRLLSDYGAHQAFMPTPIAQAFIAYVAQSGVPPTLKRLLTGGDRLAPLPPSALGFDTYNHYGPTEATVVATAGKVDAGDTRVPDIGKPIAGTRIVLLDRYGDPVPLGAPGEICISGPGLALGYWGQPAETARTFVPDPYCGERGARMYRSGDLARYRSDGALDFLGRLDSQVKRSGIRIEPAEIEAALAQVEGVQAAAIDCLQDHTSSSRLVAVVADSGGTGKLPADLRERLAQVLPAYMLPDAFVAVAALPLLPSGKVDRAAVRELARNSRRVGPESTATPRAGLEAQLAAIWADLLGTGLPGAEDNFFAMGGHSMLAIQLAARIRDHFGVEIDVAQLFEHPLFGQQHEYLDCLLGVTGRPSVAEAAERTESGVV